MTQGSPTQTTLDSHVFVSYASQDAAIANSVVASLESQGLKCWIAPRDVVPGALYADEIVGAINEARVVVLVLSEHGATSPHVDKEIERASSKGRRIVVLRTDSAPLTRAFEYLWTIKSRPSLNSLKGDPRYRAFLKKMNLPE